MRPNSLQYASVVDAMGVVSRPVLSSNEVDCYRLRIQQFSSSLTEINGLCGLFSLGRPSYAFGGDSDSDDSNNRTIIDVLGYDFFELVFDRVYLEFGLRIVLSKRMKFPGAHIFKSLRQMLYRGGGYHSDAFADKYRSLAIPTPDRLLSFTLPLALPVSSSGIQFEAASVSRDGSARPGAFIPYKLGEAVIFQSARRHRIPPFALQHDLDQRITFQAHLMPSDQHWVGFW